MTAAMYLREIDPDLADALVMALARAEGEDREGGHQHGHEHRDLGGNRGPEHAGKAERGEPGPIDQEAGGQA